MMTTRKCKQRTNNGKIKESVWRLFVGNINTFPSNNGPSNTVKMDLLKNLIMSDKTDIVLISEHNRNVRRLSENSKPSNIMKHWWERTVVRTSYLRSQSQVAIEPGGTMAITTSRATAHTIQAGEDSHLLGRWTYFTLRGKSQKLTTIISVYRPQESQATSQRQLIASIHRRSSVLEANNPSKLWYRDLSELIRAKTQEGHSILVGGDFNDDLSNENGEVVSFMRNHGLREVLVEKYGSGPATYIRGQHTIDGLFASNDVQIIRGVYCPFHRSPSDHRWIMVEIDQTYLIGGSRIDRCPPVLRRATSKIPSVKNNFQQLMENQVTKRRLDVKVHSLFEKLQQEKYMDQTSAIQYERIETQLQEIVRFADRRCRLIRRGKIPFSPMLRQLIGNIIILKQFQRRFELKGKINRPHGRLLQRLIKKYAYVGQTKFRSIEDITKSLRLAKKQYQEFKPKAYDERRNFLSRIAYEHSQEDNRPSSFHYRRLFHIEQTREHFRILRSKEGKPKSKGVDRIIIQDETGEHITYEKSSIEKAIMDSNEKKLLQSYDTPLRSGQLQALFGEQGKFDTWEAILEGNIQLPEDANDELKMWYHFITNYEKVQVNFEWTAEEYCKSWEKMDENKVTTPGVQVAHIKCLSPTSSSAIILSQMAMIPFLTGYSPERWRVGIDSMIPKKTAELHPDKLRLILLMDARFNHNNKLIGKKMMEVGEQQNWLAPEQFGSRKAKSAIEHAINKRLSFDIIRQQNLNAVYIANDAKSCYDRILLIVAYLTMRNFGIPSLVAKSSIDSILRMKHYVRTSHGYSSDYYGGDKWKTLPHGCGQGNGYGPALWACISSPLLHLLRANKFGAIFDNYLMDTTIHLSGIAFVDDTDMIEAESKMPRKNVMISAQHSLNQWNSTLRITGGALEPQKTFYCIIRNNSHETYSRPLTIRNHGTETQIESKNPKDSFFSLGVWQSPTGSETKQVSHMLQKIDLWTRTTGISCISKYHARTAMHATLGRTIAYPLPACSLTKKDCSKIQSKLNMATLSKMGIVRSVSHILATTPIKYSGYGVIDIHVEQLVQHMNVLQQHMHEETVSNKLIRISLDQYIFESGTSGNPFGCKYKIYTTPCTWIESTMEAMHFYGLTMCHDMRSLQSWCKGDLFIMDKLDATDRPFVPVINKVRIYLQVVTLSDLLMANWKQYNVVLLQGNRSCTSPSPSRWRYLWNHSDEPTETEKTIWRNALHRAFNIGTAGHFDGFPDAQGWHVEATKYSNWLFSTSSKLVYEKVSLDTWKVWTPILSPLISTRRSQRFTPASLTTHIPTNVVPCTVLPDHNEIQLVNQGACTAQLSTHPTETLDTYGWITQCVHENAQQVLKFLYALINHNGVVHTDGSRLTSGQVTYGYVLGYEKQYCSLASIDVNKFTHGYNAVPGHESDSSSYRGELAGILAAIVYINYTCKRYGISAGKCTLYCDSRGAVVSAFGTKRPTPRWKSFDLVTMIRYHLRQSPIVWLPVYVKSHQDDHLPFHELSMAAQGNAVADLLATKAQTYRSTWPTGLLPGEPWRVTIAGQTFGGNIPQRIRELIFVPRVKLQWIHVFSIPQETVECCMWKLFFHHWKNKPRDDQIWWTKFASRAHPIGRNLVRRRHSSTGKCPGCGLDEDPDHLLQCKHVAIREACKEFRTSFYQWSLGQTDERLIYGVIHIIEAFQTGLLVYHPIWSTSMFQLFLDQFRLGTGPFLTGLWLQQWVSLHSGFLIRHKKRSHHTTWILHAVTKVQALIRKLWSIRNNILHSADNQTSCELHSQLNAKIETLMKTRPPPQIMSKADAIFFRRHSLTALKKMNITRKQRWLLGAEAILNVYNIELTPQSHKLRAYFQWDPG